VKASCIILAGGKSSRLKSKAFILLNKKPLIIYVLDTVKKLFSDIIIVVKNKKQKKNLERIVKMCTAKIIEDKNEIFSPIAGIKEGIKHVKNDYVFVIACDMPFIKEKTIRELLSRISSNVDCVFYAWSTKKFEPLCAVYKKDVFSSFNPKEGLHNLIRKTDNKILIPVAKETKEFFNINTKKDLLLARKLLGNIR